MFLRPHFPLGLLVRGGSAGVVVVSPVAEAALEPAVPSTVAQGEKQLVHRPRIFGSEFYTNHYKCNRKKVYESKKEDPVIQDESQVEKIHSNLQSYFGQSKWDIASEAASRSDLIFELRRMQTSKSFHERELSIHKFLNGLGIALEATPFLFLLVYIFLMTLVILNLILEMVVLMDRLFVAVCLNPSKRWMRR